MTSAGVTVIAGEALVDLVPDAGGAFRPLLGGGPFNTARTIGRLGQPTAFLGLVSRDRFGDQLAVALAADGVRLDETLRTDLPTSLAMAELDDGGSASYRFYFSETSAEALTCADALGALPERVCALHVGGLGLILEPLASAVEALVEQLAGQAIVMVDPNVRPSLISDRDAFAARLARIILRADIVKASDEDLRALMPDRSTQDAAKELLGHGVKLVLLTLGSEGAVAFGAFGSRRVRARGISVVDTIGAGDVFSGAWLARWLALGCALSDGDAVQEATDFACRAAAFSCSRRGASPPSRDELAAITGVTP